MANAPVNITVTGAAGNIGYALLFRIASGALLGPDQRVNLRLLEIPPAVKAAEGTAMELFDSAFPTLGSVDIFDDAKAAFEGANIAFLVGSMPRKAGMERADLLSANGGIFGPQGEALNAGAADDIKVLVVGNPANTNAYIAMKSAPDIPPENFTALMRLDHHRAVSQVAEKINRPIPSIEQMCVWGNHSPTMYADYRYATSNGESVQDMITEPDWNTEVFMPKIAGRGAAIIAARGSSSAASAANAAIYHLRDWLLGSSGKWITMGVPSDGSYGIPESLVFGFPVVCDKGSYRIVQGLDLSDEFSRQRIAATLAELEEERAAIQDML